MMETSDWLVLALLVHLIVAFGVFAYCTIVRREPWLSPMMQFLLFLELFTIPLPIRALQTLDIEGDITEHLPQIFPYLAPSLWLVTVALLVYVTTYYLPPVARIARGLPTLVVRPGRSPFLAALGLGCFSLFLIATLARSAGGIIPFILLGYGATSEMFGKGYLAAGFPWLFIASMLVLVRYAMHGQRRDLAIFGGWFGAILLMNVVMGQRSTIVYEGLTLVVFWHLAVARIRLVRFAPLLLLAFVGLNVLGLVRGSKFDTPQDVLNRLTSSFTHVSDEGDLHHGLLYTLTTGEFVVPFETLPTVMRAPDDQVPIQWGGTLLTTASLMVPSVLWPERPLPLGAWYMRTFYGNDYGLNEGRGFYFLTEGWLDAGPGGVLIVAGLWGFCWGIVGAYTKDRRVDPAVALVVALLVAFMSRCIAGDSATLTAGIAQQAILPLIPAYAYLVRFERRRAPARPT